MRAFRMRRLILGPKRPSVCSPARACRLRAPLTRNSPEEERLAVLKTTGCRISMDGKGRGIDNVFIERLWRSVKYEEVYLHSVDLSGAK